MSDAHMTPEEWEKVEALFSSALALPAAERREHLKRSVGADARLRADVEELLHAHGDNAGFLSAPLWAVGEAHDDADDGDRVPERIGPYQVLRRIGRGGMGQVFLAEREAHDVRLQVALKVMRRGMDSADLVKRFKMERLILASLDHAHIARLLDVGVTDTGAPYIVMEYVQGESILAFADRARLSVVDRLALFKGICAAVQHAHRRLVVHRDLKPQNILVNADGVPKLLDFGIARILDADAGSDGAMHTDANARLLTPGYAAPEQLRGEPVTTACDVYALGVLLYELLAGCHPFAYDGAARAIVQQRVLETEPAPPSTRTSHECAANRRTSVSSLRTTLRGDLDTIVLKALRKEAEHRYGSASALDDDLDRYLHGQPVRARSATRRYRVGKFVQRNRAFVAVAAVLMAVLVASSALTAYQARRIGQEAARVASERDKALEVRTFLLEIFGTTGPDQPTGDSVTARALLDRRAATLGTSIRADDTSNTDLRAEMMSVLAEGYEKLGLLTNAEPLARSALTARLARRGDASPDVMSSRNQVGWILHQLRNFPAAEKELRQAVAIGRRLYPGIGDARLARALNDLGVTREARGDYDEAAALYRESIRMRPRAGGGGLGVAISMSNLSVVLYRKGDIPAALVLGDSAHRLLRTALGDDHMRTTIAQSNLAALQSAQGDHAGAARQHRDLVARRTRLFGAQHPTVASSMILLANELAADSGGLAEAQQLLRDALSIQQSAAGTGSDVATTLRVLGDVQRKAGRYEDAMADYRNALALTRKSVGETHERVATLLARTALIHDVRKERALAVSAQRDAVGVATRALGGEHRRTVEMRLTLARYLHFAELREGASAELLAVEKAIAAAREPATRALHAQASALRTSLGAHAAQKP